MNPEPTHPDQAGRPATGTDTRHAAHDNGELPFGWRVLAVLQFAAAGFFVLALATRASRDLFPNGLRALFQGSPQAAALAMRGAICLSAPSPARLWQTQSRAGGRAALRALRSSRPGARREHSWILSAALWALAARGPPR